MVDGNYTRTGGQADTEGNQAGIQSRNSDIQCQNTEIKDQKSLVLLSENVNWGRHRPVQTTPPDFMNDECQGRSGMARRITGRGRLSSGLCLQLEFRAEISRDS